MGPIRIGPGGLPGVGPPAGWGFKMSKRQKFKLYENIGPRLRRATALSCHRSDNPGRGNLMPSASRREIASPANSLIKVFRRSLAEGATHEGWLAVEGPFLVEEALNAAPRVKTHSVLVASGAAEKFSALLGRLPAEAEVTQVPDRLFASVAQTPSPQGIAALVELPAYTPRADCARAQSVAAGCLPPPGPRQPGHDDAHGLGVFRIGVSDFAGNGEPFQSQGGALLGGRHLPAAARLRPRSA